MQFTKMHGAGNDYVYIDGFKQTIIQPSQLATAVSERHFGIGSDGLILILPSSRADLRMQMFNADGSEAEMCGNGLRCVAKYAWDHKLVDRLEIRVETGAGIMPVKMHCGKDQKINKVCVNMGQPHLRRAEIPMTGEANSEALGINIEAGGQVYQGWCLSMGNPHCVIFVDDCDNFPVATVGPLIENHPLFPRRTNVEFVSVISNCELRQRTWERGAGETLACGTGASAVTAAAVLSGRTDRKITNHLKGGPLELEWAADNCIYLTGPAAEVFTGDYPWDPK
ncbi:diaminopimelate epimerase [Geopsychrobacter electrodiphilus]|uniref:diaminopimelate epimerase n=1 Tax=Geopsychrobacter electrodiphilus TaxID=225196 RepID=UPI00036A2200|nr:diaminopimelate epimerase [Geopsychrobacter electrodiphilus]